MLPLFTPSQGLQIKRGDQQTGFVVIATQDANGVNIPLDITGYRFELRIGPGFGSPRWLTLSTDSGAGLTIPTPTNGELFYDLEPAQTLICQQGAAVYDLKIFSGIVPTTIMSGSGVVFDEVR